MNDITFFVIKFHLPIIFPCLQIKICFSGEIRVRFIANSSIQQTVISQKSNTAVYMCGKSLIKSKNNVGPKAVPTGTPESIVNLEDVILLYNKQSSAKSLTLQFTYTVNR